MATMKAVAVWCVMLGLVCSCSAQDYENNSMVQLFREYIRINTSQPSVGDVDYTEAVAFIQGIADDLGLPYTVYEYKAGKPIVVITWTGTDPTLPSIMLNSHMDVVAADEDGWIYPPFNATMDSAGNIYGRGTQDMKCVGIWYMEAIRQLRADNVTLQRTLHVTFVPDEEIGSEFGMKAFIQTEDFTKLNVSFALDEGIAYPNSSYIVFNADKSTWQFSCTCYGAGGHGSTLPANTAADKFRIIVDKIMDFRNQQRALIADDPSGDTSRIVTINLTKVSGGSANNIIASSMTAVADMRIPPGYNSTELSEMIDGWMVAGGNCTRTFLLQDMVSPVSAVDDSNSDWVAFKKATDAMGMQVVTMTSPGSTDERFVRTTGVSGYGFSPMPNTNYLLHTVNEYINAQTLIDGKDIYYNILKAVGIANSS